MDKSESILKFEMDGSTIRLGANLSKRELFAALIMAGFAGNDPNKGRMICDYKSHAYMAVTKADELIKMLAPAGSEGEKK